MTSRIMLAVVLVTLVPCAARADCTDWPQYLHWRGFVDTPGISNAVAIQAGYAYVADGSNGLVVVDISHPDSLAMVGGLATGGDARSVAVAGSRAYVAAGPGGLWVIDISDPHAPVPLGSAPIPGSAMAVEKTTNPSHVAVAGPSGIYMVNVANPTLPLVEGSVPGAGPVMDLAARGMILYAAEGPSGLRVVDATVPTSPVTKALLPMPPGALGVCAFPAAPRVTVLEGSALAVVDVTAPTSPTILGSTPITGGVALDAAMTASGSRACVARQDAGILMVDVSVPSAPLVLGEHRTPGLARGVAIIGNTAYVANDNWGLISLDITGSHAVPRVAVLDTPGFASDVVVRNTTAFVADGTNGIVVIDISTPSSPSIIRTISTSGSADQLGSGAETVVTAIPAMGGYTNLVIVRDYGGGFAITAGSAHLFGTITGFKVVGTKVYVAAAGPGGGNVYVVDVSDPFNPVTIATLPHTFGVAAIEVSGNRAYVVTNSGTIEAWDISDPAHPRLLGYNDQLGGDNRAIGIVVAGNYAYVQRLNSSDIEIMDISDPTRLLFTYRRVTVAGTIQVMKIFRGFLQVLTSNGLTEFDLIDPLHPPVRGSEGSSEYPNNYGFDQFPWPTPDPNSYCAVGPQGLLVLAGDCASAAASGVPGVTSPEHGAGSTLQVVATPNPFTEETTVSIAGEGGDPASIEVFDAAGRRVRTMALAPASNGQRLARWGGRNDRGDRLPGGVYFLRATAGGRTTMGRAVLNR